MEKKFEVYKQVYFSFNLNIHDFFSNRKMNMNLLMIQKSWNFSFQTGSK